MKLLMKAIFFAFLVLLASAFEVGDYVELEQYLNARSQQDFRKTAQNVRFSVPPGTQGKVLSAKHFKSGNFGIEVQLKGGPHDGEKVFVYYTPGAPNMKFATDGEFKNWRDPGQMTTDQEKSEVVAKAKAVETKVPVRAYSESAEATTVAAPAVTPTAAAVTKLAELKRAHDNETCATCNLTMTGSEQAVSKGACESQSAELGKLMVARSEDAGICSVEIYPKDNPDRKGRSYTFYSDGHIESVDNLGVRGFYVFPRNQLPQFSVDKDQKTISITSAAGQKFSFSAENGRMTEVTGVKSWSEGPLQDKTKGMFNLEPNPGQAILDLPYQTGGFPERVPTGNSVLHSDAGSCSLPNKKVFDYTYDGMILDQVKFKFKSDQDFFNQAAATCSQH